MNLIAQVVTTGVGVADVMQFLGPLGIGGILAWFMWYTVTTVLPEKEKRHEESLIKRDATIERIATKFDDSLREERLHREREASLNREAFECRAICPICKTGKAGK